MLRNNMSQVNDADNIYAMSDEQLLQVDLANIPQEVKEAATETATEEVQAEVQASDEEIQQEQVAAETSEEVQEPEVEEGTSETKTEDPIDYKSFYDAITKPFVANGKEVQVANPEDITRLMQQGAGFHKKMEALKPLKRINRLLEENNLLDENDLNYLIDIHHKKPEAIAKLIKDSGIDLLDFDVAKGEDYSPTQRTVDDTAIELQNVLDDLKINSPSYSETIGILGNQWDTSSREILAQHPELIRIIDSQVQDGTFAKVSQGVERERMLGNLQGISDIQAYRQVGEQLFGSAPTQVQPQQQVQPQIALVPPTMGTVPNASNAATEQRKKAAASPRTTAVTTSKQVVDISTLNDEQLLAYMGSQH